MLAKKNVFKFLVDKSTLVKLSIYLPSKNIFLGKYSL